ncbi:MAG: type I restriction endonuclease subunit R [Aeromicrobium sp.]|uniref:type I restriction endonuclease subunit R n=1 Tax=Aeromicrobium sp. TaxID=1871063 RepID=UPI0039E60772
MSEPDSAYRYEPVSVSDESTVVAEFVPEEAEEPAYQSEAELEEAFIEQLRHQAYEYLPITTEAELLANLRTQLEALNQITFSDAEWRQLLGIVAAANEGIVEKTARLHTDHVQVITRDDGTAKNISLIDKANIHNNRLQVINQYEVEGTRANRYDVTVLANGLPMVHIELKRRGVDLREAFNQINRYQRESFWAGSGLFEYVQLFVISNGTLTKYYSNTTRDGHLAEQSGRRRRRKTSNSFEFTSWWSDATNAAITDLVGFTKTFFAKHTLLNLLTKYCVFDVDRKLLVMRPYQIVAAEQILQRILTSTNARQWGSTAAGGYIWHTTGSGKTLTSFKAAQLASAMEDVDKVLFVVDRKDLDYQTQREYDRFEKGAVDGTNNTAHLKRRLEDPGSRIIVTTIQKLANFVKANKSHPIYTDHVVLIFDECHRSQFGDMHTSITRAFKRYHLFGFTGTPIFTENAGSSGSPRLRTTEQAFGDRLHTYTIVDAIRDKNVLPFRIDYVNTVKLPAALPTAQVTAIDTEKALRSPERADAIVCYVLDHFDQKTRRNTSYLLKDKRVTGFNSLFAADSIDSAKHYYNVFEAEQRNREAADPAYQRLKTGVIYSYAANEEQVDGVLGEESFDTSDLDQSSREFLDDAIADYNDLFGTSWDSSADGFQSYYKDLSKRLKSRELDMVIVVNMFLTGFDATTLNTLWVDKNLRSHGLIQAYSRTNRILNSVKTYGNIVAFRDLEQATNDALALFGNREARGVVLLKPYADYNAEYQEVVAGLRAHFPLAEPIVGEAAKKEFISLFGQLLRLRNILTSFDEFAGDDPLTEREFQDYRSRYLDLHAEFRHAENAEKESINDDVVFEIELVKQVEVNVDYILLLIEQWRQTRGDGGDGGDVEVEARQSITRAVDSSPSLRNKSDLIMAFVDAVNVSGDTREDWRQFVTQRREAELAAIIAEEGLRPEPTREFMADAFRDGAVAVTGTAVTRILPPVSRFSVDGGHSAKKQRVVAKLSAFHHRYSGLV